MDWPDQDRALWNRRQIDCGLSLLDEAARLHTPGPYQLQAAIVACHAEAGSWQETDWRQIVVLYDALFQMAPTPVVRLNRAIARSQLHGPAAALRELEAGTDELSAYNLFHAARAQILLDLGDPAAARTALGRALNLTTNPAERSLLERRLQACPAG